MRRFIIPLAILLASGAYFYIQACPTFYYWDSAELTAAALGNGVPHPPGFPFFLILSKLWLYAVPLNSAFSLNIFSAFFGAVGLLLWYLVMVRVLRRLNEIRSEEMFAFVSWLATGFMAMTLTYAVQATRYEVYSLNFAGFAGIVLLCLLIVEREKPSRFLNISLFLILGMLLAVHNLTIALAIPGILLFLVWTRRMTPGYAILGVLASFILAGLTYIFLLFRAMGNPPLNWGDPSSLGRLVDYILVKGFATSTSRLSATHISEQLAFAYDLIYRQIGPAAMALSLYGLGYTIYRKRDIGISLCIVFVLNISSVAFAENYFYENYDLHGYLMISVAISILFLAVAFLQILKFTLSHFRGHRAGISRPFAMILFTIFAVLVMAPQANENFLSADLSKVTGAEEYSRHFLSDAPAGALVITSSYNTYFCALAFQSATGTTADKTVLNMYNWDHEWGISESDRLIGIQSGNIQTVQGYYLEILNRMMNKRPLYIEYDQSSIPIAKYLFPRGMGYIFVNPDSIANAPKPENDDSYLAAASQATDLETIRTWTLWLKNRGDYYTQRGNQKIAARYLTLIDSLATNANLK